jgi:hypothetical protein
MYITNLLIYLLHGAESFLRSQPVNFAASQEIPRIYGMYITCTLNCNYRIAEILHTLKRDFFRYVIVNTVDKCD